MKLSTEQLQQLIEDLRGSTKSIAECMPTDFTEDDLSEDDLTEIAQEIFQCDTCSWWLETSEEAEQSDEDVRVCEDCLAPN